MSIEKLLKENIKALNNNTDALNKFIEMSSNQVIELEEVDTSKTEKVEDQLDLSITDDSVETVEVDLDSDKIDIPAPEDRPFAAPKKARRPTAEVKLEKAEKAGSAKAIAESKLALAKYRVSNAKRELTRLSKIKPKNNQEDKDKHLALSYAEHDLTLYESELKSLEEFTEAAVPAMPVLIPLGEPEGYMLTTLAKSHGLELTYQDWIDKGWSFDNMIAQGYLSEIQATVSVKAMRNKVAELSQTKDAELMCTIIAKYCQGDAEPCVEKIPEEDRNAFIAEISEAPNK